MHYLVLIALVQGASLSAVPASTAGAIAGALVNYRLNHRYTFESDRAHGRALPRFALVALVGIAVNAAVVGRNDRLRLAELPARPDRRHGGRPGERIPGQSRMDVLTPRAGVVTSPAVTAIGEARHSISVVVPVYDEAMVLPEFHRRLAAALDALDANAEIIYVDDGSRDASATLLAGLHATDPRVAVIGLSRNFGKEVAMTAGIDHAQGDAVIVIDADLQDPPELIGEMVRAWRDGADVVLMRRAHRAEESLLKRSTAAAFYRVIGRLSAIDIPEDVGDFRLMSRRAVQAFRRLPERSRFMKGLFAWIGFPTRELVYDRDGRFAGKSKWNYWKLWNFALEGITSFSAAPLKIASYVGFLTALVAFAYGTYVIGKTLLYGDPVRGYPTLVVVVLFLGGLQLMALGIIGEYLARMFVEVKQRPLYLVAQWHAPARPLVPCNARATRSSARSRHMRRDAGG